MTYFKQKQYSDENRVQILSFLCRLEGWRTIARNFHWSALDRGVHEYMEDFEEVLSDYQDELAEVFQGMSDQRIGVNELRPIPCECTGPLEWIETIISNSFEFYQGIPEGIEYIGVKSCTEDFIKNAQKYRYLLGLCR